MFPLEPAVDPEVHLVEQQRNEDTPLVDQGVLCVLDLNGRLATWMYYCLFFVDIILAAFSSTQRSFHSRFEAWREVQLASS